MSYLDNLAKKLAEQDDLMISLATSGPCSLAVSPGKSDNWVEKAGHLPNYICHIAKALRDETGMPTGRAIAIAVSRCKVWAAGGGDVDADTRAKAEKAVAEWTALKAKSHAKS